jgi:hypothetical protein
MYLLCSTAVWAYLLIKQVACFSTFSVMVLMSSVLCVWCVDRRYRARHDGWSQRGNLTDPVFVSKLKKNVLLYVQRRKMVLVRNEHNKTTLYIKE